MHLKRSLFAATAALTLMITACSTPDNISPPTLEAQFGTVQDDIGLDVAVGANGQIYALSKQSTAIDAASPYSTTILRRFNATGGLALTTELDHDPCYHPQSGPQYCARAQAQEIETNAQDRVYVTYSDFYYNAGDCLEVHEPYVNTYDSTGRKLSHLQLGVTGAYIPEDYNRKVSVAVDSSGNLYAALEQSEVDAPTCTVGTPRQTLSKYTSDGDLLWQRTPAIGLVYDVTVSGTGNIYVVGSRGMARYSSTGNLVWRKTGSSYAVSEASKIVASGSNLYVRSEKTVRKYEANGKLLWSKLQGGLNTLVFGDMTADANGNVYISGKYRPTSSSSANTFVRKLRPTGAILWTKTFGTPQYDDARGIATSNGSEIYVTGETQGSLAHPNRGGPENRDGYLRKLNSLGNPVWIR